MNVAARPEALRELRDPGWHAWEDEPGDRIPLDSAARTRRRIGRQLT